MSTSILTMCAPTHTHTYSYTITREPHPLHQHTHTIEEKKMFVGRQTETWMLAHSLTLLSPVGVPILLGVPVSAYSMGLWQPCRPARAPWITQWDAKVSYHRVSMGSKRNATELFYRKYMDFLLLFWFVWFCSLLLLSKTLDNVCTCNNKYEISYSERSCDFIFFCFVKLWRINWFLLWLLDQINLILSAIICIHSTEQKIELLCIPICMLIWCSMENIIASLILYHCIYLSIVAAHE